MAVLDIDLDRELAAYRRELTGYCYRMLGSGFEAEDAVQETLLRAWKAAADFEGRSSVRSWLYRIATNVCLDMLRAPQRRAMAMDLTAPWSADTPLPAPAPETEWVSPIADDRVLPPEADPAELASLRDSVRLAFVAALQHLPPRQRAVLILREVLKWQASEVAELFETSVASVNSLLQRARATLADRQTAEPAPADLDEEHRALLARYLAAFEAYDVSALVSLISEDANFTMPPFPLWLRGTADIAKWYTGQGAACEGSRLLPVSANGTAGFAAYKQVGPGLWKPFALQVIEVSGGRLVGLHHFLDAERLFAAFGVPAELTA
ncbi:MAG TPA: sigma-70 family RNA polymerase sigma factor [Frankiaceae bacterium]|nr:sigma-70 family RNA polymerase sigma factor [Frankiaceae bacterium]